MPFKETCLNLSTKTHVCINTESTDVPATYIKATDAMIEIMKPKMDMLDKISLPFIENVFVDTDRLMKRFEDINMEIDAEILNKLSKGLYEKTFDELNTDEQAIIKVLACYICIQN